MPQLGPQQHWRALAAECSLLEFGEDGETFNWSLNDLKFRGSWAPRKKLDSAVKRGNLIVVWLIGVLREEI